jgi:hypothetical protein
MENLKRMQKCPRFHKCNAPICPLDIHSSERTYLPGEEKCTLPKTQRVKLGKGLPYGGLTKKEYAGLKSWLSKTAKEMEVVRKRLAKKGAKTKFTPRVQSSKDKNNE